MSSFEYCPHCGRVAAAVLARHPWCARMDVLECLECGASGLRYGVHENPCDGDCANCRDCVDRNEYETDPDDRQYDDCDVEVRDYDGNEVL